MAALPAGQPGLIVLHQRLDDLQARTNGQSPQALPHVLGDLGHRHTDPFRKRGSALHTK
jgi:hypothetical protein